VSSVISVAKKRVLATEITEGTEGRRAYGGVGKFAIVERSGWLG
jgi:hypothetical protein